MRIRTIKPEWLDDEQIVLASDAARVASIALILLADDYGNGRANERLLAARIFPGEPAAKVREAMSELSGIGFIELYEVRDQDYYSIRNWSKHQRVDKPGKPRVPGPCEASGNIRETPEKVPAQFAPDLDQEHRTPNIGSVRSREDWQRVAGLFAKRYEAARGMAWHYGPHVQSLEDIATQARSQAGDFDANVGQALDSFFADEWAQGADYPPGLLAKQFGKHFKPPGDRDKVAAEQKRQREQAEAEALQRKLDAHAKDAYVPSEDEIADMVGDFGKGLRGQA